MNRNQFLWGVIAIAILVLGAAAWYIFAGDNGSADEAIAATSTYKISVTSDDRTMGSPKAPLTVIEYAAPTCPFCAHFFTTIFPDFKKNWVDTGKAYFVFRVFPLSAVDVAAESMARCLPANRYFHFIDLLYHNQDKWDPDGNTIPDVHAALVKMGQMEGMTPPEVDFCINDQALAKHISQVGEDGTSKYGIDRTPTIFANGQTIMAIDSYEHFNDALTAAAKKK